MSKTYEDIEHRKGTHIAFRNMWTSIPSLLIRLCRVANVVMRP